MPRIADGTLSTRLHTLDVLDVEILEALEERDRILYGIVGAATRYRTILHEEIQLLRAGKDPELVRGAMARWRQILLDIRRLAEAL